MNEFNDEPYVNPMEENSWPFKNGLSIGCLLLLFFGCITAVLILIFSGVFKI
jgi:hypothetical protein